MAEVRIGTSGFSYKHWKETFYPPGLAQRRWFEHYCTCFSTVELNVTFYRMPQEGTFRKWHDESPEGFLFALKGSRYITHIKRLLEPEEPVAFLRDRARLLKEKLGPVLWQLPPNFPKDVQRLKGLLKALKRFKARHVFEFRDETWMDREVFDLLTAGGHALCEADWPPFNAEVPATTDFVYVRRHGAGGGYDSCYSTEELRADARRIRAHLKAGRDVFVYFNNDYRGYAPRNALELLGMLKG